MHSLFSGGIMVRVLDFDNDEMPVDTSKCVKCRFAHSEEDKDVLHCGMGELSRCHFEMCLSEAELDAALSEMIAYVETQVGISYYELKNYAEDNAKHEWLAVMRSKKHRECLAYYLRSKRRADNVPYRTFFGLPKENS